MLLRLDWQSASNKQKPKLFSRGMTLQAPEVNSGDSASSMRQLWKCKNMHSYPKL
jgi:hypothetical protein